ncbi:L-dopachrome tautomerase-related protein [Asaia sp. HN010]|uniref:L-dopachrome tautomerase-related protein n=1 Tax=Asaia sp. HN010 TaxID=3081233 RepID=UPI003016D4A1
MKAIEAFSRQSYGGRAIVASLALGTLLSFGLASRASERAEAASLRVEATSTTLDWNAVAQAAGRIFVSGPRWTGFPGPSVALLEPGNRLRPFPDRAWNDWKPGLDARRKFVNVNALHVDAEGKLWVVDTGTPQFGGPPVAGGAKLVRLDAGTGEVIRIYLLGSEAAPAGTYIDDIRFNGAHAYLTDAGTGALLVLDIESGRCRRVLAGHPAVMARADRPIVIDGRILRDGKGQPLRINVDPLEVSPDGKVLYFGPLEGPWSQVPTAALDDASLPSERLAAQVTPWADLPPIGGSTMDPEGRLYFAALKDNTVYRRERDGRIVALLTDPRLHWADAPILIENRALWLPAAQLDRLPQFNLGKSAIQLPFALVSLKIAP